MTQWIFLILLLYRFDTFESTSANFDSLTDNNTSRGRLQIILSTCNKKTKTDWTNSNIYKNDDASKNIPIMRDNLT